MTRLLRWLFERIAGRGEGELLSAELQEEYEERLRTSDADAVNRWYRRQLISSLLPALRLRLHLHQVSRHPQHAMHRNGDTLMETLWRELTQAMRSLARAPGFAVVVIVTLGLGIGANASIFSVVNALMLRAVDFPNAPRLAVVWEMMPAADPHMYASPANLADWRAQSRSFEQLAGFQTVDVFLTLPEETIRLHGALISGNLLATLGVTPLMGRGISAADDDPAKPQVAMISERVWRNLLSARPDVIGSQVTIYGNPVTVVGVMPNAFEFPPPIDLEGKLIPQRSDVWLPFRFDYANAGRNNHFMTVLGLLRPGVELETASREMSGIARQLAAAHPESNAGWGTLVVPIDHAVLGDLGRALTMLLWAVGVVLLIVCVNVANLFLGHAEGRTQEYAVRRALGASNGALMRQALVESQLLALAGGALGLILAGLGTRALLRLAPPTIPNTDGVAIDGTVLLVTIVISVLTGLLFGLAPAWRALHPDTRTVLASGVRSGVRRSTVRLRRSLVIAEVSLSVMLLVGAGLLVRSFVAVANVDTGLRAENVVTARLNLPASKFPARQHVRAALAELEQRLSALPGVEAAGFSYNVPLATDYQGTDAVVEGEPEYAPEVNRVTMFTSVTPGFFAAAGIATLEGRTFDARDDSSSASTLVVNRSFVQKFFPRGNAIGQRLLWGGRAHEIVGVVGDVKLESLKTAAAPVMYFAHAQTNSYRNMTALVRGRIDADALIAAVQNEVRAVDRSIPLFDVATLATVIDNALAEARFSAVLLLVFAALALVLAAIGVYGVLAYAVTRQQREIGVRIALGASPRAELRRVILAGMTLVAVGLAVGLAAALAGGRLLQALLFGVQATDPLTFAIVAVSLLLVAAAASTVPALRASRADPILVLRGE